MKKINFEKIGEVKTLMFIGVSLCFGMEENDF